MYAVSRYGITLAFTSESLNLRRDNQPRRADNDSIGRERQRATTSLANNWNSFRELPISAQQNNRLGANIRLLLSLLMNPY